MAGTEIPQSDAPQPPAERSRPRTLVPPGGARRRTARSGHECGRSARSSARRRFGNYTSQMERTRDMDIHGGIEAAIRNLRHSARALRKTPAFTVAVVADPGARYRRQQRGVFRRLRRVAAAAAVPQCRPPGDAGARSTAGDKQPFVAPVAPGGLEPHEQHVSGDFRLVFARRFRTFRRPAREAEPRICGARAFCRCGA